MHQMRRVAAALYEQLGTPKALAAHLLLKYGEIAQLQQLRADPQQYLLSDAYYKDAIACDFLRKCALGDEAGAKLRYERARDGFLRCEAKNFRTNRLLYRFIDNAGLTCDDEPVILFIEKWRKNMKTLLGRLPSDLTPRFSGGSTATDRGPLATVPEKMTSSPSYYPGMGCLLPLWWETLWGRAHLNRAQPQVIRHNVFFTVPKDGEVDRGCAMEASMAVSYQLDVGQAFRKCLKKAYGVVLNQLQPIHRKIARRASLSQDEATIDLSNASNMVCRALPELVLPEDWFSLVDSLRATHTLIDGRIQRLEMFSSMGNGYTFELETVLFLTLARTVVEEEGGDPDWVSVYGDDIIVPSAHAQSVLAALSYFGFDPNKRKTFVTGPFRESCGGDFFDGAAVRPAYVKELPTEPQHWFSVANALWRLPQRWVSRARMECLKNIPSRLRKCQGPEELGDVVIHGPSSFWNPVMMLPPAEGPSLFGEELNYVPHYRAYLPVASYHQWHNWPGDVQLACACLGESSKGPAMRDIVSYREGWVVHPGSGWLPRTV